MIRLFLLGLLPLLAWSLSLSASEDRVAAQNPLAGMPSKPGPHIEKLAALGDNSWLNLGCPEPDPTQPAKEGVARGRSWGGRALRSAPDLRGAFFCGTGVHGAVKSDGRYMDDLWFYDLNAHRWVCLYPGADCKTLKLTLDEHNFEVNEQGDFVPVSYLSHAYGNTTYNPDLRKFVVIWCNCCWWKKALPQRNDWLGVAEADRNNPYRAGKLNSEGKHPIFWDVATGKWERRYVEGPGPKGWSVLAEYIPSLKKLFVSPDGAKQAWLYDYQANAWTQLKTNGITPGANGCYDPKRERIWFAGNKTFGYFDLKTNAGTEIKAEGQPEDFYCPNGTVMNYDAASGEIVLHMRRTPGKSEDWMLIAYDPEVNRWLQPQDTLPADVTKRYMARHGFYDAELNAHFIYLAGDSSNSRATMLAYRYKRAATTPPAGEIKEGDRQ